MNPTKAFTIPPLRLRVLGLLLVLLLGVGCPCIRGPVNASPGLRWWLFSNFGAQRMCPEMLKRGAPLKLTPGGNIIGRFFPEQCTSAVNDQAQTVTISFAGTGFAWTPIAGRVGFSVTASVEYSMDFYMSEDDGIYIWARAARIPYGPDFKMGAIENKLVNWAAQGPVGYMASTFGSQIVQSQIASGFTVIHGDDGDEFSLGQLQPPQHPPKPFNISKGGRIMLVNDTTEVHSEQLDLLGPFEVSDKGQALFMRFRDTGPTLDVLILRRGAGDLWRSGLQLGAALAPPPEAPVLQFPLVSGNEQRQKVPLPPGQYYVVLDNSSAVGSVKPPWNPLGVMGGNVAVVAHVVELGDADDDF
ncbi:MAG TPA: hypothetical protein VGM29_00875 [Polyangiaceae bacterium]